MFRTPPLPATQTADDRTCTSAPALPAWWLFGEAAPGGQASAAQLVLRGGAPRADQNWSPRRVQVEISPLAARQSRARPQSSTDRVPAGLLFVSAPFSTRRFQGSTTRCERGDQRVDPLSFPWEFLKLPLSLARGLACQYRARAVTAVPAAAVPSRLPLRPVRTEPARHASLRGAGDMVSTGFLTRNP